MAEGVIAIYYGMKDESISLFGFGCDSFVEVFSACIVFWQLFYKKSQNLTKALTDGKNKEIECERQSTRTIGVLLIILALSTVTGSIIRFIMGKGPATALSGLLISAGSLSFMYFLYYYKTIASIKLESRTLEADANCSLGCIHLSVTMMCGSILQMVTNAKSLWWVDAAAAIIIAGFIFKEGLTSVRVSFRKDFDGTVCGCC